MDRIKIPLKLDKQLVLTIVVSFLVIVVLAVLYFGGLFNRIFNNESGEDDSEILIPVQLEIFCEFFDSLPALEQDDYTRRLNEIFAKDKITKKELEELLPEDCRETNL